MTATVLSFGGSGTSADALPLLVEPSLEEPFSRLELDLVERSDQPAGAIAGHRARVWQLRAKRALDIGLSLVLLGLLVPFLMVLGTVIMLDSPGPAFFLQERVGRDGRPFRMVKFRSMVRGAPQLLIDLVDANEADGPLFKIRCDPRITRIGRLIRRTSLDELPQLWNVLKGDMSLVGPRPALPHEVSVWPHEMRRRLSVKPGMTGIWQVSGRSSLPFEDYQKLDLQYVSTWCLKTDLLILAKTIPAVISGHGAA